MASRERPSTLTAAWLTRPAAWLTRAAAWIFDKRDDRYRFGISVYRVEDIRFKLVAFRRIVFAGPKPSEPNRLTSTTHGAPSLSSTRSIAKWQELTTA
jgi:hypothetical protein